MLFRILFVLAFCCFAQAENIISLAPNLTETVCYLGGEKKIIGITNDCNYPKKIMHRATVGKYLFPNIEAIIALQPATVIAEDTADKRFLAKLNTLKIHYKLYHVKGITDIVPLCEQLAQDFTLETQSIKKLKNKLNKKPKTTLQPAFIILWEQPLIAAGKNTFVSDYWARKGYQNLVTTTGYPVLNKEMMLAHPKATIINIAKDPKQDVYMRLAPRLIESL